MKLLKWIALLLFTECFFYKGANFGPSFQVGFAVTLDRLVFIIILLLAVWSLMCGKLQLSGLGKVGGYMLLFTLVCTVSNAVMGRGAVDYYRLFDFNYNPFIIFILAKSIPHSHKKLEFVSFAFLAVGAYLAINGMFERYGPHALVWPRYILDPTIGIQWERTRGSFASSEQLGSALIVTFLFYALYSVRAEGERNPKDWNSSFLLLYGILKRSWAYLMTAVTVVCIYATNQRAAWVAFALCLGLLAITKTHIRRAARTFLALGLLVFLSGAASHLSIWDHTLFSKRQQTVKERWVNNLTTLEMGKANPLFGVGYGNFKTDWPKYFLEIDPEVSDLSDGNHNTFLGLFAEVGLVGLIPYLLILCHMFRVGLRVYGNGEGFEREFALVFLLAAISYVIGANFSDYRNAQFCNTTLFLLFGTVAGIEAHMTLTTHRSGVSQAVSVRRMRPGLTSTTPRTPEGNMSPSEPYGRASL